MTTTNKILSTGVAALFALTVACGGEAETETPPPSTTVEAPPPSEAPPPAPTADTFPVAADYGAEVETEITADNVEAQLAALEAEDATEAAAPAAAAH